MKTRPIDITKEKRSDFEGRTIQIRGPLGGQWVDVYQDNADDWNIECRYREVLLDEAMAPAPKPIDEQIEEIMDEFDFDKVQRVMKFLDWKWFGAEDGIPRVAELRREARRLLNGVQNRSYIATGGFVARKDKFGRLSLAFEVTSWDWCDEGSVLI